jgi:hypothetical protein
MNETTMPALFTVLVGDDPVRRVATRDWRDDYWVCDAGGSWFPLIDKPRDVQPFIPDGTPVDRIVVKGHGVIERWIATCDRLWHPHGQVVRDPRGGSGGHAGGRLDRVPRRAERLP